MSAEWAALPQAFEAALDDDLNTAQALGQIFSQVRIVNRLLEEKNLRAAESTRDLLEDFLARARDWDAQLGLFGRDPAEFLTELRAMRAARKNLDMDRVEDLLCQRREARMQKDFTRSDALAPGIARPGRKRAVRRKDRPGIWNSQHSRTPTPGPALPRG